MNRRSFLITALSSTAAIGTAARLGADAIGSDHPVPVKSPRATSGDPVEPDWKERLTITVGPQKADLAGSTEKVVQAAVDSIARDRKSTRLNSSHLGISYAVFCLKK